MKSILITVVVLYALFSLTFCSLQRKFLYFPPQSASDVYGEMNISFVVDDMRLNGWMLNKGGNPKL